MWRNVVLAAFGATGFAFIFGIKRTKIEIIFFASGMAWYCYEMLCKMLKKDDIAMYIVIIFVVILAKGFTMFRQESMVWFTTPILIPFIPGATLYYAIRDVLSHSTDTIGDMYRLVEQLGAMVLGIITAEVIVIVLEKIRKVAARMTISQ